MAYFGEHLTYNPRAGFNSQQSFSHSLKFLANLTNSATLLNRNLGVSGILGVKARSHSAIFF